jgi:hypothetical protein
LALVGCRRSGQDGARNPAACSHTGARPNTSDAANTGAHTPHSRANTAPDTSTSYPASDPRARTAGPGPVSIANRSDAVRCSPRPALADVLKLSVEDVSGFRPGEWKDRWLRTATI